MSLDAVIIGSGPNGLAAGIVLARKGLSVKIVEAKNTIGGGMRTKELTLPGFKHDVCSAIFPAAAGSPFFKTLPLEEFGLKWVEPEYPLAHPLDDEPAVILHHSVKKTAGELNGDSGAYIKLITPFVERWGELSPQLFAPLINLPASPVLMARFGLKALPSARSIAKKFKTERAKALYAGLAAHSVLPLDAPGTSSFALVIGVIAHTTGWPIAKGGTYQIANALAGYFKSLNGEIETGNEVKKLSDIPEAKTILFDTTPRQVLNIAKDKLPASYQKKLRNFEYGPGVFKMDIALDGPILWNDERCLKAGTVHLGGTFDEIANAERKVADGYHPQKPFVLLAQQSLFDSTRAPDGKHTVWAYCHVPNGSVRDMSDEITNQIERYASGFRKQIIKTNTMNAQQLQGYNANYTGGDIIGGKQNLRQMFKRPRLINPYHIPDTNMFICSSSTPPGGGVHGMCGYHAAQSVLKLRG